MQQQSESRGSRRRGERRRTVLTARMRDASGGWSDACILNVSPHGLMIYASCAAEPGSQVTLRRGAHLVVAQVVWRKNQRIGLHSYDELPVEDIITSDTSVAVAAPIVCRAPLERERQPRDPEQSRARSRAIEFLSLVLAGGLLALAVAASVVEALARPVSAVEAALRTR